VVYVWGPVETGKNSPPLSDEEHPANNAAIQNNTQKHPQDFPNLNVSSISYLNGRKKQSWVLKIYLVSMG